MTKKSVNVIELEESTARAALSVVNAALTADDKEVGKREQLAMKFLNHSRGKEQLAQSKNKLQWAVAKMFVDPKSKSARKYVASTTPVIQKILNP